MHYSILTNEVTYSGRELRSGWVGEQIGSAGDVAVGFVGPCFVATEDLVDLDDAMAGTFIKATSMAHVLIEHPGCSLNECVLRQRLLVCLLAEAIDQRGFEASREGDDLFVAKRKLTVSIAAPSAASCLIHLGINIDPAGAPVPAIGLDTLRIAARPLLAELLAKYDRELAATAYAATKVRVVP